MARAQASVPKKARAAPACAWPGGIASPGGRFRGKSYPVDSGLERGAHSQATKACLRIRPQ